MKGYKLVDIVDNQITNQYGRVFKLNKEYEIKDKIKYSISGFHFSIYPEETLRFIKRDDGRLPETM